MPSSVSADSNKNEHFHNIIGHMMYTYGDSEAPHKDCQELLLDLVQRELIKMIVDARKVTKYHTKKKSTQIDVKDLIWQFRRHPDHILRLYKYVQAKEMSKTYEKANDDSSDLNVLSSAAPTDNKAPEAPKRRRPKSKKLANIVMQAVEIIDPLGTLQHLLETANDRLDETKYTRQYEMKQRVMPMTESTYADFCESRRFSFCTQPSKSTHLMLSKFRAWLGNPPITMPALWILNYCATEIVAQTVEIASLSRLDKQKDPFEHLDPSRYGRRDITARTSQDVDPNTLQLHQYEEALRRTPLNPGFKGCLLFANF